MVGGHNLEILGPRKPQVNQDRNQEALLLVLA